MSSNCPFPDFLLLVLLLVLLFLVCLPSPFPAAGTSYILSHSTGWKFTHIGRRHESAADDSGGKDDGGGDSEDNGDDDDEVNNGPSVDRQPQPRIRTNNHNKSLGQLGQEKQLLSFVSRSLMPHTY